MFKGSGLATTDGAPFNVSQARSLLAGGFKALEAHKQEINDLNVYPVPDGDTGTNLALTVRAIVEAVAALPDDLPLRDLCTAISQAALMGARGNSGVILSQIIRGAMEVLAESASVNSQAVVHALHGATDTAYRAVRRPVEGTILTVLREMAEAAAVAPVGLDRKKLMEQVVATGWKSVEKTPSLLKVLAEAGVVDAGGYGLVVLVEGAANGSDGWETPIATRVSQVRPAMGALEGLASEEEQSEFTYCCSFLLSGERLDQAALEEEFGALGDSLLVVGGGQQFKVHVHSDDPGKVLASATAKGVLSEIEIDNMKEQTAARTKRLQEAAASVDVQPAEAVLTQVVAVVAGEGNKALFRSLGVEFLVDGGQSMNPSAEDLLRAVEAAKAPAVIILPNNGNVIMTAEQTLLLTQREVHVVPSRSIQAGLSAAVAYERRSTGVKNAKEMAEALERVVTGEVTRAVREAQVDGVKVKADDFIGLIDDRVVVSSSELGKVIDAVIARLLEGEREMLTALWGEGDSGAEAHALVERARERYPKVEVDLHDGGQPYYPVLLSAE
jgi:DAK2 domain fusion protein YloV